MLPVRTIGNDSDKLKSSRLSLDIEELNNIKIQNAENPDYPFTLLLLTVSGLSNLMGIRCSFNLWKGSTEKENVFKAERRKYPVDMIYPKVIKGISVVHIPEGYYAIEVPQKL